MSRLSRYYKGKERVYMLVFASIGLLFVLYVVYDLLGKGFTGLDRSMFNLAFGVEGLMFLTNGSLLIAKRNARLSSVSRVYGSGILMLGLLFLAEGLIMSENSLVFLHLLALLISALFIAQHAIRRLDLFWNHNPYMHWWMLFLIALLIIYIYLSPQHLPLMVADDGHTMLSGLLGHLAAVLFLFSSVSLTIRIVRKKEDIPFHLPLLLFILFLHCFLFAVTEPWTPIWWISVVITLIGAILSYVVTISSVSEILMRLRETVVKNEEAFHLVKQSEQKYRYIFKHMIDGFARHRIIRNEKGEAIDYVFLEVNPGFERFTGLKAKDIIGKRVTEVIPGIHSDPANWLGIYGEIAQEGSTRTFENYARKIQKWYRVTAYSREQDYFTCIFSDITEQRRQISELRMAKFRAEESDRIKSAFLANVSHEIRTPLNSIIGFTDILMDDDLDPEEKKNYLNIIAKNGQRLLNTITDIINISMVESGKIHKQVVEVDPLQLLVEIYQTQSLAARKKNLELKYEAESNGDTAPKLLTDNNMLYTVLSNLVSNAIKYTSRGSVTIAYEYRPKSIVFTVRDTGIGVSQEFTDAIFERFIQEDMSMQRNYQGMGIGLAICKAYVDELGGEISVESEKGKGSTFYVELPLG